MSIVMSGAFTALMIQEMTQVIHLAAVPHRRAEDLVRRLQVGHEKPARSPQIERRSLEKTFPMHMCHVRRKLPLLQTQDIKVSRVLREPLAEPLILRCLRDHHRCIDAEYLGAHGRVLEGAVQIRADDASATGTIEAAVSQSCKRHDLVVPIERRDAEM